jgi:hypothetical protein
MLRTGNLTGALTELDKREAVRGRHDGQAVAGISARADLSGAQGAGAGAPEFQHVIDHRSESSDSLLYRWRCSGARAPRWPPANAPRPSSTTRLLFDLWHDADKDLEPLVEARREAQRCTSVGRLRRPWLRESSRLSHALAWVHSPSTVRTDTPSASATSGTVSPPK